MNDNSFKDVSYEPEITEEPPRPAAPPPKKKKKEKNPDLMLRVLPILSALILVFTLIVTVTISLINMNVTPDPSDLPAGFLPQEEEIPEHRPRPTLPSSAGAANSNKFVPSGTGYASIPSDIGSDAAMLVELGGLSVVASKAADEKLPIASMTKVMTLLVCLDYINEGGEAELYKVITLQYNKSLLEGYNCALVDKNTNRKQSVYVIDAMYGLVLESGADCAYGLAEHFAGSEKKFVDKMNEKAKALGMTSTTFTNCVGKDDYGKNLSSVRDVATMFIYALKNPLAYDLLSTSSWECIGDYYYQKLNSLVHTGIKKRDCGKVTVLGGKSGNEINAGYCLVSFGKTSDGETYVCVTAGHPKSSYTDSASIYKNLVN